MRPSQPPRGARRGTGSLRAVPYVLLMIDEAGERPVVVEDYDKLLTHSSAQWRLIVQVDTKQEGEEIAAAWRRAKAAYGVLPGSRSQPRPKAP